MREVNETITKTPGLYTRRALDLNKLNWFTAKIVMDNKTFSNILVKYLLLISKVYKCWGLS